MTKELINNNELRVEKLSEGHLEIIKLFKAEACKELEDFLKENAWKEQKEGFSKTHLFFHKNSLVGYVTILMDRVSIKDIDGNKLNKSLGILQEKTGYPSVPALKIGRLCVADDYNSQLGSAKYRGLGTIIFSSIIDLSRELCAKVGCRLLTTHAKKKTNSYLWYQKMGFLWLHTDEKTKELLAKETTNAIPMFYDIYRIIKN